jgi:hypothetical protein
MNRNKIIILTLANIIIPLSYASYEIQYNLHPQIIFVDKSKDQQPVEVKPSIVFFQSNLDEVDVNNSIILNWQTNNSTETYIKSNINSNPMLNEYTKVTGNTLSLTPTVVGSYLFTLKALNSKGESVERTINIQSNKIVPAPTIGTFKTNVTEVVANNPVALNWETTDATEIYIKSNIVTNSTTTEFKKVTGTGLSVTPLTAGSYLFTIKAVNSKGESVEKTTTMEVTPVKFSGVFTLSENIPATTTDLLIWPNMDTFSSSITNIPSGDVTALSIVFANYVNKSTYNLTLTACSNGKCVSSPAYDTLKMADNKFNTFTLNEKLPVPANGKIDYSISIVKSGSASYAAVFYKFTKTPAGIGNYVTPTARAGVSTGYYTDVKVHYNGK